MTEKQDRRRDLYSEAIGVRVKYDYLKALDLEWVLRKVKNASKKALFDLKNLDVPRVPMEVMFSDQRRLIFVFSPTDDFFDSLQDIYKITTKTFVQLKKDFENSKKRDNIQKITLERLGYEKDEFVVENSERVVFVGNKKEKPLTEF